MPQKHPPGSIYCERSRGLTQLIIKRRIPGLRDDKGRYQYLCIRTGFRDNTQGRRAAKKLRRLIHNQLEQLQKSAVSGLELQAKILLTLQQLGLKLTAEQQQTLQLASLIYPLPITVPDEQAVPLLPQATAPQAIPSSETPQGEAPTITIKKAWEEFIAFKELLPKTKQAYQSVYRIITDNQDYILTAERVEKDLKHFRMVYAKKKNFSATSINTYLTQFQVFLNWCAEFNYLPKLNAKKKYGARKEKTEESSRLKNWQQCSETCARITTGSCSCVSLCTKREHARWMR